MIKLNLIQRLFWSSARIEKYFLENSNNNISNKKHDELVELEKQKLREFLEDKYKTLIAEKEERILDLKQNNKQLDERNKELSFEIRKLNSEKNKIETLSDEDKKLINSLNMKIRNLEEAKVEHKIRLEEVTRQKNQLDKEINNKLKTISKIETTFFGSSGNKGKGVLAEMQLAQMLQKSDFPTSFYTENLQVGSKMVEFAIQSGKEGKWIPVDSKALDVELDDNGVIVITQSFVSKVKTAAREITKYLGKQHTADYGLLVLQSDEIYMKLYEYDPILFKNMIIENKVYITSPSSFINFAQSISHILEIYERVHNEEKLYNEMESLMQTTHKFFNKLNETYNSFKTTMEKHYPALENKYNKIEPKFQDKVKKLKEIGEK